MKTPNTYSATFKMMPDVSLHHIDNGNCVRWDSECPPESFRDRAHEELYYSWVTVIEDTHVELTEKYKTPDYDDGDIDLATMIIEVYGDEIARQFILAFLKNEKLDLNELFEEVKETLVEVIVDHAECQWRDANSHILAE